MRKLLTAGIFGTILSLTGANYADASIISRGFFDEAMENYATNTALDLKANQTDLTALSNEIGIQHWNTSNGDLEYNAFPFTSELFPEFRSSSEGWAGEGPDELPIIHYILANNASINVPGLAGVTNKLLNGWTDNNGSRANPGIKGMYDGWTDGDYTFPGLFTLSSDDLKFKSIFGQSVGSLLSSGIDNFTSPEYTGPLYPLWKLSQGIDQIGTLPSGNLPTFPGAEFLFPWLKQSLTYPTSLAELITAIYGNLETRQSGLLEGIIAGFRFDSDGDGSTDDYIGLMPNYQLAKNANDKIGTLPEGITLQGLYEQWNSEVSDFVSLLKSFWSYSDARSTLDGINPEKFSNDIHGAFYAIYTIFDSIFLGLSYGWRDINTNTYYSGIIDLNEGWLDKSTNTTYQGVKGLNDVIGTLPTQISGNSTTWARYGFETPIELPTTVGGMFDMLFYDKANSTEVRFSLSGIMGRILAGLYKDDGSVSFHGLNDLTSALELRSGANYPLVNAVNANTAAIEKIGTVPDGKNLAGMISETDAKIGTVPAGYDNVGAALTAMKSDIDAKNLPSTSDDGQYVLTAKKVGETITYTWVKMDLTTEEQGQ